MENQTTFIKRTLSGIAVATGLLTLAGIYLLPGQSAVFYVVTLPMALAALRWGWRGSVGSLMLIGLVLSPVLLRRPDAALPALTALILGLFTSVLVGRFADQRRQRAQLLRRADGFEDKLAVVLNAQAVWELVLSESLRATDADDGAWIWHASGAGHATVDRAVAARSGEIAARLSESDWLHLVSSDELSSSLLSRPPLFHALRLTDIRRFPLSLGARQGQLLLARRHGRFSSIETEYVTWTLRLARQAALGQVRYARADEVLERQLQEMETLQRLSQLMNESLDLEETLNAVLEALAELLPHDMAEITCWDPEKERLIRGALLGSERVDTFLDNIALSYSLDDGLSGWLARNRRPLRLADARDFDEANPLRESEEIKIRSYMGVPLVSRGDFVGTLEVAHIEPQRFSAHDLDLLQALGAQAAIAIEKASLYQASQERVKTLERMRAVAQAAGQADDLPSLLNEIVTRVADTVQADVVGVLLYEENYRRLRAWRPFLGVPDAWVDNYVIDFSDTDRARFWDGKRPYLLIEDAQSDPRVESVGLLPLALAADIHQTLLVPLEAGGEHIGFIQVASPRESKQRFTDADVNLLTMLTAQLSGMVRISQLLEEMERRNRHMRSLVSVASAIGTSLDLDDVLTAVVEAVAKVLGCERTAIFVMDDEEQQLQLAAARGANADYVARSQTLPLVKGGRAHAAVTRSRVISEDVLIEPHFPEIAALAERDGLRAFADLPLLRGEEAVGLLSVQFMKPHHFSQGELNVLNILGEQAAVAIENARLYEETDEELKLRVAALEALQRVTQEITSTLNLDQILSLVLEEAVRFGDVDRGFILTWRPEAPLSLRTAMGYGADQLAQLRSRAEAASSDLRALLASGELQYSADLAQEAPSTPPALLADAGSLLLVPVFYQERLAALIGLHSAHLDAFSTTFVEFVEGLAAQTSIAVGNARRYEEQMQRGELMHQRAEQMRLFLEVSRTMRSDRPLDEMLMDIAYATQEATEYDLILISVLEGDRTRRVAGAGMPLMELERLKQERPPWSTVERLLDEQFRIGNCYYIPYEKQQTALNGAEMDISSDVKDAHAVERAPGAWHPMDLLMVPLRSTRSQPLGYMSVDKPRDGRVPTRASVEVLELFAAQIALAIENNRLVKDLRLQINTLSLFNEINRSITAKLDLPMVLNTVVQAVTNLLGYDYSIIFLRDRETADFIPRASSGCALEGVGEIGGRGESMLDVIRRTSMPVVVEDTAADARRVPGPPDVGASLMVPLTAEGRIVGALTAERRTPGDFSPTQVATFTALADQVSVAVENARLFEEVKGFSEELERRVEERTEELAEALDELRVERDRTDMLYRIASELVASLDIDRVLNKALGLLGDAVQASRGAILLMDTNTGYLYSRANIGTDEPIPPGGVRSNLNREEGLIGWILQNRESVIIPDVTEDERWMQMEGHEETRSALGVPISSSQAQTIGAIFLHSTAVAAFTEDDRRLVEAAAVQLGNAMNNAELYRMLREQAERLGSMLRTQQIEATKHQAILEGIADGVMVADANGRVILFNEAAERILSVTRTRALGRLLDDMLGLYGERAREWMAQVKIWQENPKDYESGEFLAERLETEQQVVSMHLSPVISKAHEFLGVVAVFRDVTAEVEADRAKSEFVSNVSHELRTPMTSIKGYVDLMLLGASGEMTAQQQHFMKIIKGNTDRLTSLVNDLLDISRIETGRIELECEPLDIGPLIEQVLLTIRPKAEEKGQRTQAFVPAALPLVYGDPDRVVQILTNLVGNAYKYTPRGGEFSVHAYVREEMLHVAVCDTGIGISEEDQKKVFERFFRVDDPLVHEESGTGLGLSITVSLIHMHGGEIFLDSEYGVGSNFTFTLPLAEGESPEPVGTPPKSYGLTTRSTVLVVEDEPEVADLLRLTLESDGHRVLATRFGEEALKLAREERPDLISLDIRLPDLSGFEVLELLKRDEETTDIPVVIISVVSDSERGLKLGAIDYLTKPLDVDRLLEVIDQVKSEQGTVLVAEDDPETLRMLREALRGENLAVRTTPRGDQALQLAQAMHPALVLLDLKMPGMDGATVLKELRRNPRTQDIPVIVMTGTIAPGESVPPELEQAGVVRFLTKPFSMDELAGEISQLIDGNGKVVPEA